MRRVLATMAMMAALAMTARAEVIAEIHTDGMENAIEISEPCPIVLNNTDDSNAVADAPQGTETAPKVYEEITVSEEDGKLLEAILWAEANNQSFEGQKAVIEVIFNRVLSDEWPDTIYDVLSQKGQFATWKSRNKVKPTEVQSDVISDVLRETETVLPDTSYVFFDRRGVNGKNHVRIQDHVFGR